MSSNLNNEQSGNLNGTMKGKAENPNGVNLGTLLHSPDSEILHHQPNEEHQIQDQDQVEW